MVPLSRSKKAVLVGDHQQLPPIVPQELINYCEDEDLPTEYISKSLFEILWDKAPEDHKVLLDTQYRSPDEIIRLISRSFYEGKYKSGDNKLSIGPVLPVFKSPVVCVDTSGLDNRYEKEKDCSYFNPLEAQISAEIVQFLLRSGIELNNIGIITPYNSQAEEIRRIISRSRLSVDEGWLQDNVATVDSFQGQEREVILFCFTRSNPAGRIGFLSDLRRLNVTLTRVKQQLILIGDFDTLSSSRNHNFSDFIRALKEHFQSVGDFISADDCRRRIACVD